jgi:hypothetical protein
MSTPPHDTDADDPKPVGTVRMTVEHVRRSRHGRHRIEAWGTPEGTQASGPFVRLLMTVTCPARHLPYQEGDQFDLPFGPAQKP